MFTAPEYISIESSSINNVVLHDLFCESLINVLLEDDLSRNNCDKFNVILSLFKVFSCSLII
jgi:hypothetical protein